MDLELKKIWLRIKMPVLYLYTLSGLVLLISCVSLEDASNSKKYENTIYSDYLIAQYAGFRHDLKKHARYTSKILDENPDNLSKLNLSCRNLIIAGYMQKAYECAEKLIEYEPDNKILNLIIAINYFKKGQYFSSGIQQNQSDANHNSIEFDLIKVWHLVDQKKIGQALKIIENYENKKNMISEIFKLQKAYLYEEIGKIEQAEQTLLNLKFFNKRYFLMVLGAFYVRQGEIEKTLKLYQNNLHRLSGLDLDVITSYLNLLQKTQNKQNIKTYPAELNPSASKTVLRTQNLAQTFEMLGTLYYHYEILEAALLFYRLALFLDDRREESKLFIATIFDSQNINDMAYELFNQFSKESAYYDFVQLKTFLLLQKMDQESLAFQRLKQAVEETNSQGITVYSGRILFF